MDSEVVRASSRVFAVPIFPGAIGFSLIAHLSPTGADLDFRGGSEEVQNRLFETL